MTNLIINNNLDFWGVIGVLIGMIHYFKNKLKHEE